MHLITVRTEPLFSEPEDLLPKYFKCTGGNMKLFDFSMYVTRRDAQHAADRVEALKERLNEPGAAAELKRELNDWLTLHREVLQKAS